MSIHLSTNSKLGRTIRVTQTYWDYIVSVKHSEVLGLETDVIQALISLSEISGLRLNEGGQVIVDDFLRATGYKDVFVIGDAAARPYSGLAQTAIHEGEYVADYIAGRIQNKSEPNSFKPKKNSVAVPVGIGWAAVMVGPLKFYGLVGWWLRLLGDYRYYISVLPLRKALTVMRSKKINFENNSG